MTWRTGSLTNASGFQISRSPSAPGKCPVCGASGSNCSSGKESTPKILLNEEAPPEKQIIQVLEDVVEERKVGPETVKEVKAKEGDYLSRPEAERLGLV